MTGDEQPKRVSQLKLAAERKEEWLEARSRLVRWFAEPWPVSCWNSGMWVGYLIGLLTGLVLGVAILG